MVNLTVEKGRIRNCYLDGSFSSIPEVENLAASLDGCWFLAEDVAMVIDEFMSRSRASDVVVSQLEWIIQCIYSVLRLT